MDAFAYHFYFISGKDSVQICCWSFHCAHFDQWMSVNWTWTSVLYQAPLPSAPNDTVPPTVPIKLMIWLLIVWIQLAPGLALLHLLHLVFPPGTVWSNRIFVLDKCLGGAMSYVTLLPYSPRANLPSAIYMISLSSVRTFIPFEPVWFLLFCLKPSRLFIADHAVNYAPNIFEKALDAGPLSCETHRVRIFLKAQFSKHGESHVMPSYIQIISLSRVIDSCAQLTAFYIFSKYAVSLMRSFGEEPSTQIVT